MGQMLADGTAGDGLDGDRQATVGQHGRAVTARQAAAIDFDAEGDVLARQQTTEMAVGLQYQGDRIRALGGARQQPGQGAAQRPQRVQTGAPEVEQRFRDPAAGAGGVTAGGNARDGAHASHYTAEHTTVYTVVYCRDGL